MRPTSTPSLPGRLVFWLCLFVAVLAPRRASAEWIWVEGEAPTANRMNRHPWWYDQVKKDLFSGGDFISNFSGEKAGEAEYRFEAKTAGAHEFWVRANPLQAKLSYSLNGGAATDIDLQKDKRGEVNVAADGKADLRFLAWSKVGHVELKQGANTVVFRMASANSHHGYLDCFVLSTDPFQPRGLLKPDRLAAKSATGGDWFAFDPKPDPFATDSAIDLRFLNERVAGEHGFIDIKNGEFIRSEDGQPLRFWAVNGPPHDLTGDALKRCARMLAKYGVNMVRVHGGLFDERGEVDPAKIRHALEVVRAMKAEGIYTHFSIYFPLWLTPKADLPFLKGYDGTKHPFAALMFNPDFQEQYRKWWTTLLTTKDPETGRALIDEPAVASVEMQNEDSFFFWTFSDANIPDAELQILETRFADWLKAKHGSLDAAFAHWNGMKVKRDSPGDGRVGFRPLWNIANERTPRDQDTAAFLLDTQTRFYADTVSFLRKLGFKGRITASNWSTASPERFGPLEKLSYTPGDFIDRHGYFGSNQKGDNSAWSIREGHTYSDRSALRFDAEEPGKPRQFIHPGMDPHYNGLPSMISETTWNRPNRFRSEAPLYLACFGALQHSDAIVHFALDGDRWSVKPAYWTQPWTLMSPAMAGQFPAAALIFRQRLVKPGDVLAEVRLNTNDLRQLKGTPLPQDAALDELRLQDVPVGGAELKPGQRIDPLIHFAGRTEVFFTGQPSRTEVKNLTPFIDHVTQTVMSTTGELSLDYGQGVLTINAPAAQGASGNLKAAGRVETRDLILQSDLALGHIVAVSLDGKPLVTSGRILLQAMSEERSTGFQTEAESATVKRIVSLGTDPWQVRTLQGSVAFKRPDAASLHATALDLNGYPTGPAGNAASLKLQPATVYYLIAR
jgi:hypothetical protein